MTITNDYLPILILIFVGAGLAGMFTIIGALSHCSRRPLVLLVPVILFEIWNGQTNISLLTSSAHMVAITYGYTAGYYLQKNYANQE